MHKLLFDYQGVELVEEGGVLTLTYIISACLKQLINRRVQNFVLILKAINEKDQLGYQQKGKDVCQKQDF